MILRNLIYILQSENYDFWRFLSFCYSHLAWWRLEQRQKIVWTMKARALQAISMVFFAGAAGAAFSFFGWVGGSVVLALCIMTIPFFIGAALLLLLPFGRYLKWKKVSRAREILRASGVRVIGITGSYGKTTTKEILAAIWQTILGDKNAGQRQYGYRNCGFYHRSLGGIYKGKNFYRRNGSTQEGRDKRNLSDGFASIFHPDRYQ